MADMYGEALNSGNSTLTLKSAYTRLRNTPKYVVFSVKFSLYYIRK